MGAQPVGEALDVGHGKGASMTGVPYRLVYIAQVKSGGLESIVLLYR